MKQKIYFVDAFADNLFQGNQAGVCITKQPLEENLMQQIASENNLSETAFVVMGDNHSTIRWFTPSAEVALCGHATLASGFILFNELGYEKDTIEFTSKSGILKVTQKDNFLSLDFPAMPPFQMEITNIDLTMFNIAPISAYRSRDDFMFVFNTQDEIKNLVPDLSKMASLDCRGVIVTAPGDEVDFVSRFFAPGIGIPEDPVTGSAHTTLTPYWSKRLSKQKLFAKQLSKRGGSLICCDLGERIEISGNAVLYMKGEISI